MGFGDVKLMGCLGAFLGWESIIFIVFISSLLGTLFGVTFILSGNKEWQSKIPFGPYISLAAIIWMLGGSGLWDLYIQWMQGAAY
jgi:leader peptidase (prepilin peptidase)/N-methyltransferase